MLKINHLSFRYPKQAKPVFEDINLELSPGGVYGLLGPNGAGKSTLLYLICGLLTPKTGDVLYNNVNTRRRLPETLADIFLVPEEFELPNISLSEYIKVLQPFYPKFSVEDLHRNLDMFGFDHDMNLQQLSLGQKKKAYMCVALAANTPLLLMDEPTNGLDIPSKANFRSFIASNMTDDCTVIISTHQVADISQLIDHVLIMNEHEMLLNQSLISIMDHLAFGSTNDQDEIAKALFAQPSINGTNIVTFNPDGIETMVNLETLFQFVTTRPDLAREIFKTPVNHESDI